MTNNGQNFIKPIIFDLGLGQFVRTEKMVLLLHYNN